MNRTEFELMCKQAKDQNDEAIKNLIRHASEARSLVIELAEGLEDEGLKQQVNQLVG